MSDVIRLLLIDLSALFWAAWRASAQKPREWAFEKVLGDVVRLSKEWPYTAIACDEPPYDRRVRHAEYKAHRVVDEAGAEQLRALRDELTARGHRLVFAQGQEADDIIATLALLAAGCSPPIKVTVVTRDKDLCAVVTERVTLLDPGTKKTCDVAGVRARWGVEPAQVSDLLALMGDTSDNVPGVPKVGEKSAAELLGAWKTLEAILAAPTPSPAQIVVDEQLLDQLRTQAKKDGALAVKVEETAQGIHLRKLLCRVHAHRPQVEISRDLTRLRTDLALDFAGIFEAPPVVDHRAPPADPIVRESYEAEGPRPAAKGESNGDASRGGVDDSDRRGNHGGGPGDPDPRQEPRALDDARAAGDPGGGEGRAVVRGSDAGDRPAPPPPGSRAVQSPAREEPRPMNDTAPAVQMPAHLVEPREAAPLAVRQADPPRHRERAPEPEQPSPADGHLRTSGTIAALAGALAEAQGEIEMAAKDSTNPAFHRTYADLASVWRACRPALSRHGLAVVQVVTGSHLVTRLFHSSGEWIEGEVKIALDTSTGRSPVQALGSAITYLRRYTLSALVGVAPDEDDDGNGGQQAPQRAAGGRR